MCDRHVLRGGRVLDVGCRDARHLIELARRYDLNGVGIDPVPWHIERAVAAIADARMGSQVQAQLGRIEQFDAPEGAFDLVWCRDVIEVLPDLGAAVAQLSQVLSPSGVLVAYTNVLNGAPDPAETRQIHEPLGNVVGNLVEGNLEAAFSQHGLRIVEKVIVGTQWREYLEERDRLVSRDLLRLARLRRDRVRIIAAYGEPTFQLRP